jgi:hypothetical protein
VEYSIGWLQAFLHRGSGLHFDEEQAGQIASLAERKLIDLFDMARETALANGRTQILRHDLPLTRGLRTLLAEVEALVENVEARPLFVFLAEAGVPGPIDELVKVEVPRMMAALLLLAGRIIAILEPTTLSSAERLELLLRRTTTGPTSWELERATRVLSLTL